MHSPQFTAEPSSNDTVERDSTEGDVPGLPSPAAEPRLHDVRVLVLEKETEREVGLEIALYIEQGKRVFILDVPASEEELDHTASAFDHALATAK